MDLPGAGRPSLRRFRLLACLYGALAVLQLVLVVTGSGNTGLGVGLFLAFAALTAHHAVLWWHASREEQPPAA